MQFEFEDLPKEETIAGKCPREKEVYNFYGYTKIRPSNCILPTIYKNSLQDIRNFEIRSDDTFVISNPKCGTTWCMEMVWMIANNCDLEGAKVEQERRFPSIDVQGCVSDLIFGHMGGTVLHNIGKKPSPRFIKSHLPKELLPTGIWEKKPKIVFVMRNPKDAAVSNYHHHKLFHSYEGTLEEFLDATLDEKVMYSPFWEHAIKFWEMRDEPNLLILTFEEMKKDLVGTIRKTAAFLEKDLTEEQVEIVRNHVSFDSMKNNKSVNYETVREFVEKELRTLSEGSFIREGQSGGQKMSEEYAKKFDEWTKKKIAGTGLEKLYG